MYEFPFDTTSAIVNLICSGTLERCAEPQAAALAPRRHGAVPRPRLASLKAREPERTTRTPTGALAYLRRLYYDTGLSNHALAVRPTIELAEAERIVFGTDRPYAGLPATGGPAPDQAGLDGGVRAGIDAANAAALVPRFAAELAP
jgi:6-methylsalicylate decarboxylase